MGMQAAYLILPREEKRTTTFKMVEEITLGWAVQELLALNICSLPVLFLDFLISSSLFFPI